MESIKKLVQQGIQPQKACDKLSINSQILKIGNRTFLKKSSGELTKIGITTAIGKLSANFKKLDNSFFSVLAERAKHNGFDDDGLISAVNTVIDNFIYQEPKVADILKINTNVQLFTYYDVMNKNDEMDRKAFEHYRPIEAPGLKKPMYASIHDIEKYNLVLFKIKPPTS